MNTFGFIGMGNMGNAMLNGILKEVPAHAIRFTDASEVVRVNVSEKTGVASLPTNIELANSVKYIILAVKPQCYDEVIKNIRNVVTNEKIIISLAPGISIEDIQSKFDNDVRVVRCMPGKQLHLQAGGSPLVPGAGEQAGIDGCRFCPEAGRTAYWWCLRRRTAAAGPWGTCHRASGRFLSCGI